MLSLLLPTLTLSWWDGPHVMIARLVERELSEQKIKYINKILDTWYSEKGTLPSLAAWHDTILYDGESYTKTWHYSDKPIFDGVEAMDVDESFNISAALTDSINCLLDPNTTSVWAINWVFRNLIHFVGDAHTPLHATQRFNSERPTGDWGGNGCYITTPNSDITNLHKLWDSAVFAYVKGPYGEEEANKLIKDIGNLESHFSKEKISNLDPYTWLEESFEIARDYAYALVPEKVSSSNPYIPLEGSYTETCQPLAKLQLGLAAHRLALILNKFFQRNNLPTLETNSQPHRWQEFLAWALDAVLISILIVYTILMCNKNKKGRVAIHDPLLERNLVSIA